LSDSQRLCYNQDVTLTINPKHIIEVYKLNQKIMENKAKKFNTPATFNRTRATLPGVNALLSEAWHLYKSRYKTFLGITVLSFFLTIFSFVIFGIGVSIASFLVKHIVGEAVAFLVGLALFVVLFLIALIVQFWSQTALIYAIKDSKENIGIKESYKRGWNKIRPFFWTSMLTGFITSAGFVFFIIPSIIFSVWFSFAAFIVVAESLNGMNALLKSREYIREYWWNVFWRFFFAILPLVTVFLFLGIIGAVFGNKIFSDILINIVSLLLAPLYTVYSFLIYKHLKIIKGDFEFSPSQKSKNFFVIVGVLGNFLLITAAVLLMT